MNYVKLISIFIVLLFIAANTKQIVADNFYVSTTGSDSLGDGSQSNPWLTITHALASINGSPSNPHTIFIDQGIYSASTTGEYFPLIMKSFVSLQGEEDSLTILDAETQFGNNGERRLIICDRITQIKIDGLTLKNGWLGYNSYPNVLGGAVYIDNSSYITISNNIIKDNFSDEGGGIACDSSSFVLINDNTIVNNRAGIFTCGGIGGGISFNESTGMISNNIVSENFTEDKAGGIHCNSSNVKFISNEILDNVSSFGGGIFIDNNGQNLLARNSIIHNGAIICLSGALCGGIVFKSTGIIGGSIHNGNNIYNNYVDDFFIMPGIQMLQLLNTDTIEASYNYFGSHNPHDSMQVSGNFRIDPFLTLPDTHDNSNLIVIPSPVNFDSVVVNEEKNILLKIFNVKKSLVDSVIIFNINHNDTSFSTSKNTFFIPPIGEDSITITFRPSAEGFYTDTLEILTNEGVINVVVQGIGIDSSTAIIEDLNKIPFKFTLYQNYPNPFNAVTTIKYQLPKATDVKLEIYNILGQRIKTLLDKQQAPDYYTVEWDGRNNQGNQVATGLYIYRLSAKALDGSENFVRVKKMLMMK